MRTVTVACFALLAGAWSGCQAGGDGSLASQIPRLDARQALSLANAWRTSEPDVVSTLTADTVEFVLPGGERISVPLPADQMVVAVAPYVASTHACEIHSISGCSGEMVGESMWVHAETPDGTVLVDEARTAMDNGFIELWLPRDSEIDLTIEANGLGAEGRISTYGTSHTCIPELRLQ